MLWALFTLIAAAAQTARNAMQRELTATLGTVGATHVRFLFGFPFALVFLAGVLIVTGAPLPHPALAVSGRGSADGLLAQIAATALMLTAMNDRSFVVTIAYIKTEPVQVALFGFVLLGDKVTPLSGRRHPDRHRRRDRDVAQARRRAGRRHQADAARAGLRRHVRALGHRLSRRHPSACELHNNYVLAATFTLAVGLVLQSILLSAYLALRDPGVLTRDLPRLAAVAVCRLHGRARLAILVSRLRHRHRRQACARWRWSRCCSRKASRNSSSSSRPRRARPSASCWS